MGMHRISLSVAERQVAGFIIARIKKVDPAAARSVREVRKKLGVKDTTRKVNKIDRRLVEWGMAPTAWDELVEPELLLERLEEGIQAVGVEENEDGEIEVNESKIAALEKVTRRFQELVEEVDYTIDKSFLTWMQGIWGADGFNLAVAQTADGKKVEVNLAPGLMEAFADLVDSVLAAVDSPEIGSKKKG